MPKVNANGRMLYYEEAGEGPPLIFLSGLGGDHRAFSMTIRHLAARFRCLALDNRDSGQSDRARGHYTTRDMAEDVAGWMDAIGLESAHLLGQSLGALIAQHVALAHPQKVRSLILASTHGGSNHWRKAVLDSWIQMRGGLEPGPFTKATLPWLVAPRFYHRPEQIEGLIRFAERNAWPQDPDAFTRQARAAQGHELRGKLNRIQARSLVLVGEFDLVNPPHIARELADELPNAVFRVMPGVGHMPHIEDNLLFRREAQAFLDDLK
ncbi:MAG: alpha/beta hydrolase [Isosphaeraceae bacterium]